MPDASTQLGFGKTPSPRHLLEAHDLTKAMRVEANVKRMARGRLMTQGPLMDVTLIAAPRSTKNKELARGLVTHQAQKGNQWHMTAGHPNGWGMKAHIGANKDSGLFHTLTPTEPTSATSARQRRCCIGRNTTQAWAYVEHPFHVVKNIFKYKNTRCKGLANNDAQRNVLFALGNL